jgi:hypothetical protein
MGDPYRDPRGEAGGRTDGSIARPILRLLTAESADIIVLVRNLRQWESPQLDFSR